MLIIKTKYANHILYKVNKNDIQLDYLTWDRLKLLNLINNIQL